jgi:hypothetical protein
MVCCSRFPRELDPATCCHVPKIFTRTTYQELTFQKGVPSDASGEASWTYGESFLSL